jgi:hypothetical protein
MSLLIIIPLRELERVSMKIGLMAHSQTGIINSLSEHYHMIP